jgi:hypothetical protein
METVAVVLSVGTEHIDAFETGFREHELPVWRDLEARGLLVGATLNRLDISSRPVESATQYLVVAVFSTGKGHHAHDDHPGFAAWNAIADTYQVGDALAFGGETVVQLGDTRAGKVARRDASRD